MSEWIDYKKRHEYIEDLFGRESNDIENKKENKDEFYEKFKFLLNQENLDPMLYERLCKYFCEVIGI